MEITAAFDSNYFCVESPLEESLYVIEKVHLKRCPCCKLDKTTFCCASCVANRVQKSTTTRNALSADVQVLKNQIKSKLEAYEDSQDAPLVQTLAKLNDEFVKAREYVCNASIHVAHRETMLEEMLDTHRHTMHQLVLRQHQFDSIRQPVLDGLDRLYQWHQKDLSSTTMTKIREMFTLLGMNATALSGKVITIANLPLARSGHFDQIPPPVVAAALGRIVHLLVIIAEYTGILYPYSMSFNSSFSTIGDESER